MRVPFLPLFLLATPAFAQSDECATATAATVGTAPFDTQSATLSLPAWTCASGGGPDVWFEFVAPSNAVYSAALCGSTYDTALSIYEGDCGSLSLIACNDDSCGLQSSIDFTAVNGTSYLVRIGGFGGAVGSGDLTITEQMPSGAEDECSGAIAVTADTTSFSTVGATTSQPAWPCANGGRDIWFSVVASSFNLNVDTVGSSFDTALEVFEGADCGSLVSVGCNDDASGLQSAVFVSSMPGQTYFIRVGGFGGATGAGELNVDGGGPVVIGTNYCSPAQPNSTSMPATMSADGSLFVADNDLTLNGTGLPPGSFGFLLASTTQGFVPNPGNSQGTLCLLGNIARFDLPSQIMNGGDAGEMSVTIDLTQIPTMSGASMVSAGDTWNFQIWYRDLPTATGTGSNFTDGLEVTFF